MMQQGVGLTVFVEQQAKCIRKLGALMHQPLARPKQHRPRLLLFALRRHEPRFVALRRDDNRFGIGSVILSDPFIDPLIVNRGLVRSIANQAGAPVIGQMVSNSPLLSGLAVRPERHVKRFAIRSEVARAWQSVRVVCDIRTPDRQGLPAGQRCVRDTQRTVKHVVFQPALVGLVAIASAFVPYVNALSPPLAYASISPATALALMFAVDVAWQGIVTSFAASDGVVTMASRRWPGASAERVIPSADSHTGSTKSDTVMRALHVLLPQAR